jgi:serine phosphatase RsbU (regulator of sigma subunit)
VSDGGPPARGGSLSVKLILRTTLLIVLMVAGSGVLNVINIRRVFDDTTRRQEELFSRGRETLGEVGTPLFGRAVQQLLVDRGRDLDILSVVRETVAQDTKDQDGKKDYGLKLAFVLDLNQNLVAHCHERDALECSQGPSPPVPVGPALGELTVKTWAAARTAWQEAAAQHGPALVRFDVASADERLRVFAFPVFTNAEPTAEGALAAERAPGREGYVILGYDVAPIGWFAMSAAEQKDEASRRAALYTGAVGALFALIGTLLAILQGISITRPLKQLAWGADQLARGDLAARVAVTSSDEIGFLATNFNYMADQIEVLLEHTAEKARIEQELEVARAIQETLVPNGEPVDCGTFKFAGFYQPAAQTGGDWWTWHELGGGKFLVVIGDVTGHGVPSAMITAAAKATADIARLVHGEQLTVTRLLEMMNQGIFESAQRRFVMTCFASIVDTRARTITYANAGHNFPYLFRSGDGKGEFGSLMIRGNRLGDDRTSKYESKTTELLAGDVLVWYTDGIVECENGDGDEYGEKRFRASVRKAAALDAGEMRDAIVGDATSYFADTPRKDDITMIVGRIH